MYQELLKILDIYKQTSYILLGMILSFIEKDISILPGYTEIEDIQFVKKLIYEKYDLETSIQKIIQNRLKRLRNIIKNKLPIISCFDCKERQKFDAVYNEWLKDELKLIN